MFCKAFGAVSSASPCFAGVSSGRALVALGAVLAAGCSRHASAPTELDIRVTTNGEPIAARVLLFDSAGHPVHIGTIDLYGQRQGAAACAFSPGIVGTWDGIILATGMGVLPVGTDACKPSPAIPYGRYHVVAWHGIDFERWEGDVDLSAGRGRVLLEISLDRAWKASGTLAADMHVHAHGSNDSNMPDTQRVAAQAAAGIQVAGAANHGMPGSFADAIRELHLEHVIAAVPSVELGNEVIHVGVYPVPPESKVDAAAMKRADPAGMFALAHGFPENPIVQLNHPRFRVYALFDDTSWDGVAWPPPFPQSFDAVEVLNGFTAFNTNGDRRIDDSVRDFYTLIDHGWLVAPVGNSDTHDFNWVHDGLARTLVFVPDARTDPFDQAAFVEAVRARRTEATTGPWLDVTAAPHDGAGRVGPGQVVRAENGSVWIEASVSQARFVHTERIRIAVGTAEGPHVVETISVPPTRTFTWRGRIDIGTADTWIGVTADGDTPLPIEQTGTYQHDKWGHPGDTPFAIVSPILVDADGDGRWWRGDRHLSRGVNMY